MELCFHLLTFANWYKNTFAILVGTWLHASLASVIVKNKVNITFLSVRWKIPIHKCNLNSVEFGLYYLSSRLLNLNWYYHFLRYFNCKQKSWLEIQFHAILNFLIKLLMHIALSTSCPFPFVKRIFNLLKPAIKNFGPNKTTYKIKQVS